MSDKTKEMIIIGVVIAIALLLAGWHINGEMSRSHFKPPPPPPTDAENWAEVRRQMGVKGNR